jgi:hypothetical protein
MIAGLIRKRSHGTGPADCRDQSHPPSCGAGCQKANAKIENPTGAGWLDRFVDPDQLPSWLTEADLDYCAGQFRDSGFRGPLNRYRNSERDFVRKQCADLRYVRLIEDAGH